MSAHRKFVFGLKSQVEILSGKVSDARSRIESYKMKEFPVPDAVEKGIKDAEAVLEIGRTFAQAVLRMGRQFFPDREADDDASLNKTFLHLKPDHNVFHSTRTMVSRRISDVLEILDRIKLITTLIFEEPGNSQKAISAVGRALRSKSINSLESFAHELRRMSFSSESTTRFPVLELCYSYLESYLESDDAKSCFLLCDLFQEDQDIPLESLACYGMGMGTFLNATSLEEVRGRLGIAIKILKGSSILEDGIDNEHVRIHVDFAKLARSIASQTGKCRFLVKAGEQMTTWHPVDVKDYTGISLMHGDIKELQGVLDCPNLEIFLIQYSLSLSTISDEFFRGVQKLRILDMRYVPITSLPQSLELITTLCTLHLDFTKVEDISALARLVRLEVLTVSHTCIAEVPQQFSQLTNLRLFDIRECKRLSRIAPNVISSFKQLEELYIGNSFSHWEAEREPRNVASLEELGSLSNLRNLDIVFHVGQFNPIINLHLKDFSRLMIKINSQEGAESSGNRNEVEIVYPGCSELTLMLNMKNPSSDLTDKPLNGADYVSLFFPEGSNGSVDGLGGNDFGDLNVLEQMSCHIISRLLRRLNQTPQFIQSDNFEAIGSITVRNFDKLLCLLPSSLLLILQSLTDLELSHCSSLVHVLERKGLNAGEGKAKLVSSLKHVQLIDLPKMVDIWNDCDQFISLGKLVTFRVERCCKLRKLFSQALLQGLVNLKELYIYSCDELVQVFEIEEASELLASQNRSSNSASFLQNLEFVSVRDCPNLQNVFAPVVANCLQELQYLYVERCGRMEEIVGGQESKSTTLSTDQKIILPRLREMTLSSLPKLKSFCSRQHVETSSLRHTRIMGCPELETIGVTD